MKEQTTIIATAEIMTITMTKILKIVIKIIINKENYKDEKRVSFLIKKVVTTKRKE